MIDEMDFVEIDKHGFKVLIRPFNSMPFKRMMPIIEMSIKNPESQELFAMLTQVFMENLPVDKVEEFEEYSMNQAGDIIAEWMGTND
jgi:hypothetical protein